LGTNSTRVIGEYCQVVLLLAFSHILRGYEVIHFVLTETSTADQTWLQQVVIKNPRPFRALQLQVKKGERETENVREREREKKRKRQFFLEKYGIFEELFDFFG
jgi:hypothetical protein